MSDPWILTYTGKRFDLLNPKPEDVCMEDIAHALAHINRFTGHCKRAYSVAEHSLHVSQRVPPDHEVYGLMHDAAEAYCGDVSRPLKRAAGMEAYKGIENGILRAIWLRFDLQMIGWPIGPWIPPSVNEADLRMLMTEKRDLMPTAAHQWYDTGEPYEFFIPSFYVNPMVIKEQFLEAAARLGLK